MKHLSQNVRNETKRPLALGYLPNKIQYRNVANIFDGGGVGSVNVWEVPGYRTEMTPFGGIKQSGLGYKEDVLEAMRGFIQLKTYSLPWPV